VTAKTLQKISIALSIFSLVCSAVAFYCTYKAREYVRHTEAIRSTDQQKGAGQ